MIRLITAVVCICSSAIVLAEKPIASISGVKGPALKEYKSGDLIMLTAEGSVGDHKAWSVFVDLQSNPEKRRVIMEKNAEWIREQAAAKGLEVDVKLPPEDSTDQPLYVPDLNTLHLASYPGRYRIVLAVSNAEDVVIANHELEVLPTTPVPVPPKPVDPVDPVIPPGPGPAPDTSLSGSVAAAVAKAVTTANQAEFLTLAETYSRLGALAADGTIPSVEMLTKTTEVVTAATVIQGRAAWATIQATVIAPKLVSLQSTADFSAAWKAIAAGIKAGAGAQPPPPPVVIDPPVPVPVPGDGVRVFIRYDANNLQSMSSSQAAVLDSIIVREWLDKNTPVLEDGKHAYRFWHEGIEIHPSELDFWKQTNAALKHQSLPWLFISNGDRGFSGPLPNSVTETIALLNKHL